MKRSLTLLLASLMLVFALTACGGRDNASQDSGQNESQNESTAVGGDSANGGSNGQTGGNNGSLLEDAGNAVEDGLNGMENAVDDITGNTAKNQNGSAGTHGT